MERWAMDKSSDIHKAFTSSDVAKINDILATGSIDVNSRDVTHGLQTLLMHTCHIHVDSATRESIFDKLLELGADVNLTDSTGRTALAHACIAERADMVELLSRVSATDPNLPDSDGNTALLYAVRSRNATVLSLLLQGFRNLDINHSNNKGRSALMEAETQCDSNACKLLVSHGADVSVLTKVSLGRDVRSIRQARCPTPEALSLSPRSPRRVLTDRPQKLGSVAADGRLSRTPRKEKSPLSPHSPLNGLKLSLVRGYRFSRSASCSSDKDSVTEEIPEEDEEQEEPPPSGLRSRRKNSLSLPDLREPALPMLLRKQNPSLGFNERFPSPGSSPRCGTPTAGVTPLPRLAEEDDDVATGRLDRRGSLSLPNLVDFNSPRKSTQEGIPETDSESDEEIFALSHDSCKLRESRGSTNPHSSLPPIDLTPRNAMTSTAAKISLAKTARYNEQTQKGGSCSKRTKLLTTALL